MLVVTGDTKRFLVLEYITLSDQWLFALLAGKYIICFGLFHLGHGLENTNVE